MIIIASLNIKFSPDEVEGIANEIVNSRESVCSEVTRLHDVIINDLCANWDGNASNKYADEFETLKADVMDKFIAMLDDLNVQLHSIIDAMRQADEDIASQISMK